VLFWASFGRGAFLGCSFFFEIFSISFQSFRPRVDSWEEKKESTARKRKNVKLARRQQKSHPEKLFELTLN
jgi:hypothetical protein